MGAAAAAAAESAADDARLATFRDDGDGDLN